MSFCTNAQLLCHTVLDVISTQAVIVSHSVDSVVYNQQISCVNLVDGSTLVYHRLHNLNRVTLTSETMFYTGKNLITIEDSEKDPS